jgi:hypothetical protein
MRTEIVNGRLVVRDNPNLFWLFYSFFIIGGSRLRSPILNLPSSFFQWETHRLMALGGKVGCQRDLHHLPRLLGRHEHMMV